MSLSVCLTKLTAYLYVAVRFCKTSQPLILCLLINRPYQQTLTAELDVFPRFSLLLWGGKKKLVSKIVPLRKAAPLHPSSGKGPKTPTAASRPSVGTWVQKERKKATRFKTPEGAPVLQLLQTQQAKLNVSPCYFGEEKRNGCLVLRLVFLTIILKLYALI